jgi:hypothetical protein
MQQTETQHQTDTQTAREGWHNHATTASMQCGNTTGLMLHNHQEAAQHSTAQVANLEAT